MENKKIIEDMVHELIYEAWDEEREQTLRANLEEATHNPAAKLTKERCIDNIIADLGAANGLRKEVEDELDGTEYAADQIAVQHRSILKSINDSFVL